MRQSIIIIILFAMMPFAAQSQHYGFYRGSRGQTTYHGTYNHVDVRSTARRSVGNPAMSRGSRIDLGVSSEMSINTGGFGTMSGGSGSSGISSGVTFGRTGGLATTSEGSVGRASLPQMATTTLSQNEYANTNSNQQEFLETPTYTATPIGDAVVPLLMLLIPIVILKFKKISFSCKNGL